MLRGCFEVQGQEVCENRGPSTIPGWVLCGCSLGGDKGHKTYRLAHSSFFGRSSLDTSEPIWDLQDLYPIEPMVSIPISASGQVLEASKVPVDLDSMRRCLAEGHPIVFGLKLTQRRLGRSD